MSPLNRHLPPVPVNQFSMVPRQDVPRSKFKTTHTYKTTFDGGYLIPVFVDEVLPGDVYKGECTLFARMATPVFPVMDNLHMESFFFFVPNRLVWTNWVKMMGERKSPADSISFVVPTVASAAGGFPVGSIADFFGLPTTNAVAGASVVTVNALPFRAYNLIWNEWFRDQNLNTPLTVQVDDGPDNINNYGIIRRNKIHDYFTSCLPWPTKNNDIPIVSLGATAPVKTAGTAQVSGTQNALQWVNSTGGTALGSVQSGLTGGVAAFNATAFTGTGTMYPSNLYADLGTVSGLALNTMRLAVATQHLLEADARGGTRYTELLRNHFGVMPQDSRLQRPEYIGGGYNVIQTQAIPQTSATGLTGGTSPLGSLGGATVASGRHSFSCYSPEHGYIIGLVNVRADLTYQQGIHRMWTRSTRYDFYWPAFAFLGEQVVRNDEIYAQGSSGGTADAAAFGYQERWAEYRHRPSRITGWFRSTLVSGTLDAWHLSQKFTALPTLNATFMYDTPPVSRVVAAGVAANGFQFLFDSVWHIECTRAMPVRSVPGLSRF